MLSAVFYCVVANSVRPFLDNNLNDINKKSADSLNALRRSSM